MRMHLHISDVSLKRKFLWLCGIIFQYQEVIDLIDSDKFEKMRCLSEISCQISSTQLRYKSSHLHFKVYSERFPRVSSIF